MSRFEVLNRLPGSFRCRHVRPLNQHMPSAAVTASAQHTLWQKKRAPMAQWRQGRNRGRWWTAEWLEHANVEDIMKTRALRQLQPVRHLSHALQHPVWTGILGPQLATATRNEGLSGVVEKMQPHPVPHGEFQGAVVVVLVATCIFLGLEKTREPP